MTTFTGLRLTCASNLTVADYSCRIGRQARSLCQSVVYAYLVRTFGYLDAPRVVAAKRSLHQ
jgi:hypothetical protein